MKVAIILENSPGCELDRAEKEFDTEAHDLGDLIQEWLSSTIAGWHLSIGDTIKIVQL